MIGSQRLSQSVSDNIAQSFGATMRGLIVDVDHFAVHDGPGIRTAVYLKGCPLHCIWCHSPETQSFSPELLYNPQKCSACGLCLSVCEQGALSPVDVDSSNLPDSPGCRVAVDWEKCTQCGDCTKICYPGALKMSGAWMTVTELLAEVEKDRPFFTASGGGVTLSGGEATAQAAFAYQFLANCHSLGIHTALETNGCAPWRVYEKLVRVVDLFLYDIKHMNDSCHRKLTGASNRLVKDHLRRLVGLGAEIIVRVPCIPGFNDDPGNIDATACFVAQIGVKAIHLLPYNESAGAKYEWLGRRFSLKDLTTQSSERMEQLTEICRAYELNVQVGG
jgi:pyruvate formate lyase activating enzyme